MKTFSLQRTNPRLSTNIKLLVTDDQLYLETINSNRFLSRTAFKVFEYNEDLTFGNNIKNFAKLFADTDVLYDVVDEQAFNVTDKTSLQFHQLYDYGVYSDISKLIDEKYRFFAPLHVDTNDLPDAFVIIRIPAKDEEASKSFSKVSDYINTGKIVKTFELKKLKRILKDHEKSSINMQYDHGTTTKGLSLSSGLYASKVESTIDTLLANETTITEFENTITNKFKEHSLIYNDLLNLEFAFDDETIDEFVRYVGMYVNFNETSKSIADSYENVGAIRLYRKSNGYFQYNNDVVLSTYDVTRHSQFANGFGLTKAPEVRVKVNLKPTPGQSLIIRFDNIVEHTLLFDSINLQGNVNDVAQTIASELTTSYNGKYSILKCFVENGNEIVIRSSNNDTTAERLSITLPSSIQITKPVFNDDNVELYNNNFIGSNSHTISLNTYFNPTVFNKLRYKDNEGTFHSSSIVRVTKYAGDYMYHLADPVENASTAPNNVWFVQTMQDQPIVCSVVDHKDFDFDTTTSEYNDVLDFDIDKYKTYLLNIVNDDDFRGRADDLYNDNHPGLPASVSELASYKQTLRNNIDKYFDSIDLNRKYLFNEVDLSTHEATTTDNEYDRLSENKLSSLLGRNRLYKFINKWTYNAGSDVYYNNYRMNIALPFRYDSFTPSLETVNRDIRYHTHSWLIIGEGRLPYLNVDEDNIKKCLSYSRKPLTFDMLKSKTEDAYDYLTYETKLKLHESFSRLMYDDKQDACYTYFRGTLLRFEDKTLNDYKFAAILFSQEPVQDDVLRMRWVRNDTFKTLTLVVNFYIPDPILTTLERGNDFYFLDRSLLYFSETIYSTGLDSVDFGTDEISLSLYDNQKPKKYLNNVVTNDWFYNDNGTTLLYVSRGDLRRFNTPLDEILSIGQNLTIDFTTTELTTSPFYGMQITFNDIQEVSSDHFWCKQILVKHVLTSDPDGQHDLDISDNIVDNVITIDVYAQYNLNNNLFNENNAVYISRAIAYENATYNKIVSASSNNARYRELSLSNLSSELASRKIIQTTDDNKTSYLNASIIDPTKTEIAVSLSKLDDSTLSRLANTYLFPIIRYSGTYVPQTKTLLSFNSDDRFNRVFADDPVMSNRYKLSISRLSNNLDRVRSYNETLIRDIMEPKFYEYSINSITNDEDSIVSLPWIWNPSEWKSFVSTVFNSTDTLTYDLIITSEITDLIDLLNEQIKHFCPIQSFDLTNELKKNMLTLRYDVSDETLSNFDVEREIVKNFIENTFIKIYELKSVQKTSDNSFVNFVVDDSILTILDDIDSNEQFRLTFKR